MFPIGDRNPRSSFPIVTLSLIVVNIAVFLYELSLGPGLNAFIERYGVIPSSTMSSLNTGMYAPVASTFLSASFIHGGWLHLIFNMLYLWVFGDNIEDRLGRVRFLLYYLLCGTIALAAFIALLPTATMPTIGASGAIAGVLGAYLVLFPRARIKMLVPLIIFFPVIELPAVLVLGFWFAFQVVNGLSPEGGNIAWWAHVGGFVAGASLIPLFIIGRPRRRIG